MKIIIFLAFFLSIGASSWAQGEQPEKVFSIVKVYKTYEWYKKQYQLWETYLKKNDTDEEAWINLYTAARMAKIVAINDKDIENWFLKMNTIVETIEKTIPNTYAYFYINSWNNSIWKAKTDVEFNKIASYAEKAYEKDPNRPEIYPNLFNKHIVKNNPEKLKEIAVKWRDSGEISPHLLAINYNMLMSTEKNAILITFGDNDTYPPLVLQNCDGIRTDVSVINIHLLRFSEMYRNTIFKAIDIPLLKGDAIGQNEIIDHIIKNKKDKPLYFALGNTFKEEDAIKDKLYNVGMAMRYSEESFNNTSLLIYNFENKFLIDHLLFSCFKDPFPEQVKRHNFMYVPGLMMVYEHYKLIENNRKKEVIETIILNIVKGTAHEEDINKRFSNK